MKVELESENHKKESELYKALYGDSDEKVIEICKMFEDGPLHTCTIHHDTPLHKATYIKKFKLANELLDQLPENFPKSKLMYANDWGNTLLHNASTSNKGIKVLKKLMQKAPELLPVRNNWGETAVFQASRYGRKKVFEFLIGEVDKFCASQDGENSHLVFFQREDKTTSLHMAILTGYYDIAHIIASKYPDLVDARAQDRLTALQILACSPSSFKSGTKMGFLHRLVYSCVSTDDGRGVQAHGARGLIRNIRKSISSILSTKGKPWCIWPSVDIIRTQKKSHEDIVKLAKILVPLDSSWKNTYAPRAEVKPVIFNIIAPEDLAREVYVSEQPKTRIQENSGFTGYESVNSFGQLDDDDIEKGQGQPSYRDGLSNIDDTPLILAAKRGCIEIVEEILDLFPQAVEYLNYEGQNVSLVAVKNRNLDIFQLILNKNLDLRSNLRVIDCHGNSILHMVGSKEEVSVGGKLKSPVLQLSEDLLLLEYLKSMCPLYLISHRNDEMKTADELLALNNEKLRLQAKEWLKRTAEHCTVIIVLIATVAFAAAYTVPGGPNQTTGFPILINKPFFLAFTMSDVMSLAFALTAVVIFLAILTSSFRLKSFSRTLPQKLLLGLTLLFLSVSMMMVSFAATVILMTSDREHWTKVAVYVAAFFPVCIFVLSYIPLYIQLADTFKYWIKRFRDILPISTCLSKPDHISTFRRGGI